MSQFVIGESQSLVNLFKNICDKTPGFGMELDVVRVLLPPRKYLTEIAFGPAERPPVTNHLYNIAIRHFNAGNAF